MNALLHAGNVDENMIILFMEREIYLRNVSVATKLNYNSKCSEIKGKLHRPLHFHSFHFRIKTKKEKVNDVVPN